MSRCLVIEPKLEDAPISSTRLRKSLQDSTSSSVGDIWSTASFPPHDLYWHSYPLRGQSAQCKLLQSRAVAAAAKRCDRQIWCWCLTTSSMIFELCHPNSFFCVSSNLDGELSKSSLLEWIFRLVSDVSCPTSTKGNKQLFTASIPIS